MTAGWQQPAVPPKPTIPRCPHFGLMGAMLTIHQHSVGHEWVCNCGKVFRVTSGGPGGPSKKLVAVS